MKAKKSRHAIPNILLGLALILHFITAFVPFISISYYSYWQKTIYESTSSLIQAFFTITFILIVAALVFYSKSIIFYISIILAVALSIIPLVAIIDSLDSLGKIDAGFYTYVFAISMCLIAGIVKRLKN